MLRVAADVQDYFQGVSELILNYATFVVKGRKSQKVTKIIMTEIEFYYRTADDSHPDPFVHGDKDQLSMDSFYFHRSNGTTYKGGTYKGLDITFGNGKDYGGILIRSALINNELIEGPCLFVDNVLKLAECDSIEQLVKLGGNGKSQLSIHDEAQLIHLEFAEEGREQKIYAGPRVKLPLTKFNDLRFAYIMRCYRFTTCPGQLKKYKPAFTVANLDNLEQMGVTSHASAKYIKAMNDENITLDLILKEGLDTVENQCRLFKLCQDKLKSQ
jgi:hypothetical protein